MPRAIHTRFFRCIYRHPEQSDIERGVNVGIHIGSAVRTLKRFVLPDTYMVAARTRLGSVCRFNDNEIDPMQFGFVLQKRSQLTERPTPQFCPERLVAPLGRKPDMGQILDSDSCVPFFGRKDDPFCNGVVDDSCRGPFPAFEPFQKFGAVPFTRVRFTLRAFALNGRTNLLSLFSVLVDPIRSMLIAVGRNDNIGDAEVHADKLFHVLDVFIGNIDGLKKIKLSLFVDQIRLSFDVREIFRVMANKRHLQSPAEGPDRYEGSGVGQNPAVVSDGTERPEAALGFPVQFIRIRYSAYAAYKHLCGKVIRGLEIVITKTVNFELIENFMLPCDFRDRIANGVCFFDGIKKQSGLFAGG